MKVILKSLSGKSLVVDVSPTDTFVDLQAHTLQKAGCLLNLQHFKYKGREIKAENNVMKYFQGVTEELSQNEARDGLAVSKEAEVSKESVSASDSVKLENSDVTHVSRKHSQLKAGGEHKRTRKFSKPVKSLISSRKAKHSNVEKTVNISSTKAAVENISDTPVTPSSAVHDAEISDTYNVKTMGNLTSVKDIGVREQKVDAKKEFKAKEMEIIHINDQHKSHNFVCVGSEYIENSASDSDRTPGSKKDLGGDMLQQNCSKQSASQVQNSIETDKCITLTEAANITTCSRIADYITKAANKQSQKDVISGSDSSVKCTVSSREESHCKDEMLTSVVKYKSEERLEDFNLKCSKFELELANTDGSMISCSKEEEKSYVEDSCVYSKHVRTSSKVNLTSPNTQKMLDSTNVDEAMLSKTTRSVDLTTVTSTKPKTSTNNTMCDGEVQPNTTVSPATGLLLPDCDRDSDHPGQLCRLCALPRQTMVYIFSETGLRLGLRSKINTWLPTHVSRTDPLPKQVCDFCIEKLDFCQNFGTSCMKAEQTLNQLFENRRFRCHFRIHGETGAPCSRNDTAKESVEPRLTSKSKQLLGESVECDEKNFCVSKSDIKSEFLSANKAGDQHDPKINSIKSETVSSEDEENNYLISEDSSELELVDMILGENYDQRDKITVPTNYCCPLCCEGNMVTIRQTCKDTMCSSKRPHTEDMDPRADTKRTNQLSLKKRSDISDNSSLELFTYPDIQYIKADYGSCEDEQLEHCSDSEVYRDSDSNSFILSFTNVKEEDDNSLEGTAGSGDTLGDKKWKDIGTMNAKHRNVNVKSEKTENGNPVSCIVCGETMINLDQCLVHALCAHADGEAHSYPCALCEMCFSVDTDLTRHFMNIHQNIKDARLLHICIVCGRRCASQRALKSHVCIPVNTIPDQLACKTCGQSFSTKARLMFHRQFHDPDARSLECVPCGMVFTEEDNLYDHVRFTHRGQSFICNECGGHFNSKAALRGHLRSHRNLRHHKCEVCSKTFLDKQTLKEHSVSHMEVKPFQCHICGKYLNRNSRLKKHLMSHELQKTPEPQECFQCTVCGETFPNEPKAIGHAQIGHSLPSENECIFQLYPVDKVYRCEFCERCYGDPAFLNAHRSSHADESLPFKCHVCGAGFATFARVATHKVTHGVYEKKDEFSVPKLYLCDSCDKAYVHWTYLSVHRKMIHAEVKHMYKCKMCPEQFVNSWSLAYHRKTRHCDTEPPPVDSDLPTNERKRWKCEYCEKRYVSQQSLLAHVNMLHMGDNPGPTFQCDQCGKRFARKLSLDSHKKTHSGMKPHVCPLCEKTFVHRSGLSSHLRLHRGDKPHSCEYCGKTFLQRGDRDDHVRKHTGERPFSCQHCPKSFRTRAMWFEHTRIHRDERPFPCDVCGSAFRRSYALKNHKTIHTGERPHVCEICNRAFRQKQDMQKHIRNYHQEENQGQEPSDGVMAFLLPAD